LDAPEFCKSILDYVLNGNGQPRNVGYLKNMEVQIELADGHALVDFLAKNDAQLENMKIYDFYWFADNLVSTLTFVRYTRSLDPKSFKK
jgi:hypothetical protein